MELTDSFGRRIDYLRLSVTDRCNLRCSYCMPEKGVRSLRHGEILSYESLLRIAREGVALGIRKVRVTGGEPLVRKGILPFLGKVAAIPALRELVLTTNGLLLEEAAAELKRAGVQRLNISLDSLRPEVFAGITRGGDLRRVLRGIRAAEDAGFPPVKINMVVMKGINDEEVVEFAALTLEKPWSVRFIEYMPAMRQEGWERLSFPGTEILQRIGRRHELLPAISPQMSGPSRNFRIAGAAGTIGIITPMSRHFCDTCNRIRVTASGNARSCLFSGGGVDLKPYLAEEDPAPLREVLRQIVVGKPRAHDAAGGGTPFAMSGIGG
ncbi:MAG TPA: GTP 3',8-cyclase MoaA [Verrucomicrobiae bacterium]|nr:GTP 3',8-cyclase MoaA [Verrucomicrobiae bacterium]